MKKIMKKEAVITFKVDEGMEETLMGMPNRSEFIRVAIQEKLGNACPTCFGTGVVNTPKKDDN